MARRSEGSGPWRRGDGRWEATYIHDGRRRSVYAKTKTECAKKLRDRLTERDAGITGDRTTLGAWIDRWTAGLDRRDLAPNTVADYRHRLGLVPEWARAVPLDRLRPDHVDQLLAELLDGGTARSTVAKVRSLLIRVLDQAVRYGRAGRNAAALTDPVKTAVPEVEPLTVDESRRLAAVADRHRIGSLITVGLGGIGLRKSEAVGLRWDRVDLDTGTLTVDSQLARNPRGTERRPPKTAAGRRTILLPETFVGRLERRRRLDREERLAAGPGWQDGGFVWPTLLGGPYGHRSVNSLLHRLCADAGIRLVNPHLLRHSAASMMLAAGVQERVIMDILGHSDLSMVRRYQHLLGGVREGAADRLDRFLSEG